MDTSSAWCYRRGSERLCEWSEITQLVAEAGLSSLSPTAVLISERRTNSSGLEDWSQEVFSGRPLFASFKAKRWILSSSMGNGLFLCRMEAGEQALGGKTNCSHEGTMHPEQGDGEAHVCPISLSSPHLCEEAILDSLLLLST